MRIVIALTIDLGSHATLPSPAGESSPIDPLYPTVFHSRWWLQATTNGNYQEAEVRSGGRLVARFPYIVTKESMGYRSCLMPELTHFLGPAIDLGSGNVANQNLKRFHLTQELLGQIGPFSHFYQKLHRHIGDTLAFEAAGYRTGVQFTYEIPPQLEDVTWRGMRDKTRNVIRRALERWEVIELTDIDAFTTLYDHNLRSRGLVNRYPRIWNICDAALAHDQGRIWAVKDDTGAILGAISTVWDQNSAHYILATRTLGSNNGIMSLLVWHAICDASRRGLVFDFNGLGTPGSRLFFTGFGGDIRPRYFVTRTTMRVRLARYVHKKLTFSREP